jgi:hypothetical protein
VCCNSVCCQVQVSASTWSLVQSVVCPVSVIDKPQRMSRPWPRLGNREREKKNWIVITGTAIWSM